MIYMDKVRWGGGVHIKKTFVGILSIKFQKSFGPIDISNIIL